MSPTLAKVISIYYIKFKINCYKNLKAAPKCSRLKGINKKTLFKLLPNMKNINQYNNNFGYLGYDHSAK